jgi:hypothetical protein
VVSPGGDSGSWASTAPSMIFPCLQADLRGLFATWCRAQSVVCRLQSDPHGLALPYKALSHRADSHAPPLRLAEAHRSGSIVPKHAGAGAHSLLSWAFIQVICPPTGTHQVSTPSTPKCAFGRATPAARSRSVLVVPPHLDGFLHLLARASVAPRSRSRGSPCFSHPRAAPALTGSGHGRVSHDATDPSKASPPTQPHRVTAAVALVWLATDARPGLPARSPAPSTSGPCSVWKSVVVPGPLPARSRSFLPWASLPFKARTPLPVSPRPRVSALRAPTSLRRATGCGEIPPRLTQRAGKPARARPLRAPRRHPKESHPPGKPGAVRPQSLFRSGAAPSSGLWIPRRSAS